MFSTRGFEETHGGAPERFLLERCFYEITGIKRIQVSHVLYSKLNEELSDIESGILPRKSDLMLWAHTCERFFKQKIRYKMEDALKVLLVDL